MPNKNFGYEDVKKPPENKGIEATGNTSIITRLMERLNTTSAGNAKGTQALTPVQKKLFYVLMLALSAAFCQCRGKNRCQLLAGIFGTAR